MGPSPTVLLVMVLNGPDAKAASSQIEVREKYVSVFSLPCGRHICHPSEPQITCAGGRGQQSRPASWHTWGSSGQALWWWGPLRVPGNHTGSPQVCIWSKLFPSGCHLGGSWPDATTPPVPLHATGSDRWNPQGLPELRARCIRGGRAMSHVCCPHGNPGRLHAAGVKGPAPS